MMPGWIKLHRQVTENISWFSECFTKTRAWVNLLVYGQLDWIDFDLANCYLRKWEE